MSWDANPILKVALLNHRNIALVLTPLKGPSTAVECDWHVHVSLDKAWQQVYG